MKIQWPDILAVSEGIIWPMPRDTLWRERQVAPMPHSTT